MTPKDVYDEPHKPPKIPLNGNFANLLKVTRQSILQCRYSPRLHESFSSFNDQSSFANLFSAINAYYTKYRDDQLVFCRLQPCTDGKVSVETSIEQPTITKFLGKILFHEEASIFSEDNFKSQQFLITNEKDFTDTSENEMSKESEKKRAAIVITRSMRFYLTSSNTKANKKMFWKDWKKTIESFVIIVRQKMAKKESCDILSESQEFSDLKKRPLEALMDFWNPYLNSYFNSAMQWKSNITSRGPVFDGLECSFCGLIFNSDLCNERWFQIQQRFGPNNYGQCTVIDFNQQRFHCNFVPLNPLLIQHGNEGHHIQKCREYDIFATELSQLATQLMVGHGILMKMIDICKEQEGSWYLNTGEDARSLCSQIQSELQNLKDYELWPCKSDYRDWLKHAKTIAWHAKDFYDRKLCEEEKHMKEYGLTEEKQDIEINL
eukprot:CAMPEP_0113319808 /NCGR_PEP_ID=MMETSP0010_2-20120614/13862_1 /TAXON_ID=216773 ORGANISM="Corethron hystrix, Strain 308" /NCGR_SAMPLE_ID=MMETSP0010_2 /ASSEMBLY_ACC=CAM_ASM_000155 /LENGTH=434 /DNA_ID=CAMNT_0000177451 /DNA_START=921 /DNA_END=2225 /DNA_ORIENTATION=- /assembly_acc=CAM_ASM_000155